MHETSFIYDLGIVIVCAVGMSIVFYRLKLPVILGYLLTGILVGPNLIGGQSLVKHPEVVHEMAELGVIFLMFYIGMEFDLKRLKRVFAPAFLALLLQTLAMMFIGLQTAAILGWNLIEGVFLGASLSISSSMVSVAVLQNRKELKRPHGQMAVGILIFEDILAVLLLVVLSGVGVTQRLEFDLVWLTTAGVGVFVVCVYYVGRLMIPKLLDFLERVGSLELIVLSSVGSALGVGILALYFDFSVALGAFLAGSILSQTRLVGEIEHSTEPLRKLFGAVFFVSVGMMIDPAMVADKWLVIVLVSVAVILSKIFSCWLGLFLGGQDSRVALQAAVVKSQIAEFSFIIAGLAVTLGVADSKIMVLAVGVALISILLTPLLAKGSDDLHDFLSKRMPGQLLLVGSVYHQTLDQISEQMDRNTLLRLIKRPLSQIGLNLVLLTGVLLLASLLARSISGNPELHLYENWIQVAVWLLGGVVCLPFLISILRNLNAATLIVVDSTLSTAASQRFFRGRMGNLIHLLITAVVLVPVSALYFSVAAAYFPSGFALLAFLIVLFVVGVVFWKRMILVNSKIEYLFMESLNEDTRSKEEMRRELTLREISEKYPWPVQVVALTVPEASAGKRLIEIQFREAAGVMVVAIGRGQHIAFDPGPNTPLFPGDQVFVFGQANQIERAKRLFLVNREPETQPEEGTTFKIEKVYLGGDSPLAGDSLAGSDLRRKFGVNVLGIQRGETRITAPAAEEILKPGDVLFVIGNRQAIERLQKRGAVPGRDVR